MLTAFANLLEASVKSAERFPRPWPDKEELDRRLRVIALLRALTSDEEVNLLRDGRLPDRLTEIAALVGLSVEECGRVLGGVRWKLTEGQRWRT